MNIKPMIISLVILSITFCQTLYAQDHSEDMLIELCKSQVEAINSMTLYKAYLIYRDDTHYVEPAISRKYKDYGWTAACFYYDSLGRIRKFADVREIVEGGGEHVNIMYFDDSGSLCCQLYRDIDRGQALYGRMYVYHSTILRFEGSAYSMDINDAEWRDFLYLNAPLPFKINAYKFAVSNVEDLRNWLGIENIKMPDGCFRVRFRAPRTGDTAVVSGNNVHIRESPSATGKIVARNFIGGFISVLNMMHKENLEEFGTHNWYEIRQDLYEAGDRKQTGYIFGAFLEPVEQMITE